MLLIHVEYFLVIWKSIIRITIFYVTSIAKTSVLDRHFLDPQFCDPEIMMPENISGEMLRQNSHHFKLRKFFSVTAGEFSAAVSPDPRIFPSEDACLCILMWKSQFRIIVL
jgi:hypothetical protein